MSRRIVQREQARRDLVSHFVHVGEHNLDAAHRLLTAAERDFEKLANMPGMGSIFEVKNPKFSGLRVWPIRGFEKYLVFCLTHEDAVEIVRVLHGSRDIEPLFRE